MILQTMTPKEKLEQMKKLSPMILGVCKDAAPKFYGKLRRASRFPAFVISPAIDFEGMGKWHLIIEAESKSSIRKGMLCIRAYQTFYVSHASNHTNIGTGIYLFNADDYGNAQCQEIPPHYFYRLRERLIAPNGIVQPNFNGLIVEMLRLHNLSMDMVIKGYSLSLQQDGKYSLVRCSDYDRKEGFDNFISYHRDGVTLGVSSMMKGYCNFTTFVPNSMLREGQQDMQKKMLAEMRKHELAKQINPLATFNRHNWYTEDEDI